ncbi:MAG: hypothetical protein IKJ68_00295 [Clostridia bacterium]|nr:hypothetical protein [Clostridia bacterium]
MKNRYLKINAEIIGLQIFFSFLSIMFMPFFSWMDNWTWVFSFLTGWLFLGAVHSTFWQLGRKDAKTNVIENNHLKDNEKPKKLNLFGGAKVGFVSFTINIIIVILALVYTESSLLFNIHRIMIGSLFGFLPDTKASSYWSVSAILCFVMYIPCITAYISGVYNFSITEKIVPKLLYKSTNKKD